MGLFKNYKRQAAWTRKQEETVYEFIAEEMEKGIIRKGLMAKALSESEGNQERADGAYIKLRFQSIKDEYVIFDEFIETIKNENIQSYENNSNKNEVSIPKPIEINLMSEIGTHDLKLSNTEIIKYKVYKDGVIGIFETPVNFKDYRGKRFININDFKDFLKSELLIK